MATKTKVKPARKKAAKKKAAPVVSSNENELDFSTAREIADDDRRVNRSPQIYTFLVDTYGGEETVYMCAPDEVPEEAQKALGIE